MLKRNDSNNSSLSRLDCLHRTPILPDVLCFNINYKVPPAGNESIWSKSAFKIFDEYANILLPAWQPNNIRRPKEKEKKGVG